MGIFDDLKGHIEKMVGRYKSKDFLIASINACVVVSMADGVCSSDEIQKTLGYCKINKMLSCFDFSEVTKIFTEAKEKYDFDPGVGESEALIAIKKATNACAMDADQKLCIMTLCCVIGNADGNFDAKEKDAVVKIRQALGLTPSDFSV